MEEKERDKNIKEIGSHTAKILFDIVTDIPESLYNITDNSEERIHKLIQRAALKASFVSTTLSIPAGLTGIITSIPDVVSVWRIQAQLVSDIAATYGKFALLSKEAMIWCLFRHSASQLVRDVAVRTGSRIVIQKISLKALETLLRKIGIKISTKLFSRGIIHAVPLIGALGGGAYSYFDTFQVGKSADTYFKNLPLQNESKETKDDNSQLEESI